MSSMHIGVQAGDIVSGGANWWVPVKQNILITGLFINVSMIPTGPIAKPEDYVQIFVTGQVYWDGNAEPTFSDPPQRFASTLPNTRFGSVTKIDNPNNYTLYGDLANDGVLFAVILKSAGQESARMIQRPGMKLPVAAGGSVLIHMDHAGPVKCDCEVQGIIEHTP